MEIKLIDYGIAYQVTDGDKKYIEINRNLYNYPNLLNAVVKHEKEHMKSKNKWIDFKIDIKSLFDFKNSWEMMKFTFRYPKALMAYSPIFIEKNSIGINLFALIWDIIMVGSIAAAIFAVKIYYSII